MLQEIIDNPSRIQKMSQYKFLQGTMMVNINRIISKCLRYTKQKLAAQQKAPLQKKHGNKNSTVWVPRGAAN